MPALPAPTEYFGLRVGLVDRDAPSGGVDRSFGLRLENPRGEPWEGRVPIVWVQGGVSWAETLDVRLPPGEVRTVDLRTRWTGSGGPLECRLPTERSPHELGTIPEGDAQTWALGSRYLPLGRVGTPAGDAPVTPAEERRRRIRETVWLVVAAAIAVVAVVFLILYAASTI